MIANTLYLREEMGTEWWYYHGHLSAGSETFGFHVAFFRQRTDRFTIGGFVPARLAAQHLWFGHCAITDLSTRRFHYGQRRESSRLAGAAGNRYLVWIRDWQLAGDDSEHSLDVRFGDVDCRLAFRPTKPVVCHDGGATRRDSLHWSLTRMQTSGSLTIDGRRRAVTGEAWMDRECGPQLLDDGAAAWNWFGIQLDDGRDLMVYDLYDRAGRRSRHARACLVEPDGTTTTLNFHELKLSPCDYWTSPRTGCRYPIAWRLRIPWLQLDLSIRSYLRDNELDTFASTSLIYWEGPAAVGGTSAGQNVRGRCFIELVGYDRHVPNSRRFNFATGNWSLLGCALSELHKWKTRGGVVHAN